MWGLFQKRHGTFPKELDNKFKRGSAVVLWNTEAG